jgi:hypothetical protein
VSLMAIFKANYVKRGQTARDLAKASIRYIQHRRGKDGQTITRTLFNTDGPMERSEAYRMIDEATKGSFFYRFVLSPDPKREDRNHDLDMRDIAMQTMLALEERVGQSVLWVGAVHADHAPHLHAHLIAVVPHKLNVKDFAMLRQATTAAALEQRRFLDLMRTHERERRTRSQGPTFCHALSARDSFRLHPDVFFVGQSQAIFAIKMIQVSAGVRTAWRRHGAAARVQRHAVVLSLYATGLGPDASCRASLSAHLAS